MKRLMQQTYVQIVGGVVLGLLGCLVWLSLTTSSQPVVADVPDLSSPEIVDFWIDMIEAEGPEAAYQQLLSVNTAGTVGDQHERAHYFGEALYKAIGVPGVSICDSSFGFGCYHSFFGWALVDKGLDIIFALDEACIAAHGQRGLGCQHGIGHGVLAELGTEQLVASLEACGELQWKEPIGGCTSGVFMEYNFSTMGELPMRELTAGGEHYPCTDIPDRFKPACYFEQPAWWIAATERDYVYTGEQCAAVTNPEYRKACFIGVGNAVAGFEAMAFDLIQTACADMPDAEGQITCIEGAAWITSAHPEYNDVWTQLCEPFTGEYYDRCIASRDFI